MWAAVDLLYGSRRTSSIPLKSAASPSCLRTRSYSKIREATIWLLISQICAAPVPPNISPNKRRWHLSQPAITEASAIDGERLYLQYCATCHNPNGTTRRAWQSNFIEEPAVLPAGAFKSPNSAGSVTSRLDHLAQITKFGIPGSDMAGHEYLSDKEIASIALWLTQNTTQSPANR